MIGSFIWRKSTLNVTLNPMLLFTGISLAARLSFSPETAEKLDQISVERSHTPLSKCLGTSYPGDFPGEKIGAKLVPE